MKQRIFTIDYNKKNNINSKSLLILNKIKAKQLIFDNIFSFSYNRPFIILYFLEKDNNLKEKLSQIISKISIKNTLSNQLNDSIYKLYLLKLFKETDFNSFTEEIKSIFLCKTTKEMLRNFFETSKYEKSLINYYAEMCIEKFDYLKIPDTIKLTYSDIIDNLVNYFNFTFEYLLYNQTEIILLHSPLSIQQNNENIINNLQNIRKNSTNFDGYYLYLLNKNINQDINQKINLVILFNDMHFNDNPIQINYKNITKLYFVLDYKSDYEKHNLFELLYKYLECITYKDNIEEIYFKELCKQQYIYDEDRKIFINTLLKNYIQVKGKYKEINFNFKSLKKVVFDDNENLPFIELFQKRYFLNDIFNDKIWCKIIKITPKDYENIFDLNEEQEKKLYNKLNQFEKDKTCFKILYLNFENNSPLQKKFIYFYEKYLYDNKNINTIIIDNISYIKSEKEYELKKLKFLYVTQLHYEIDLIFNSFKVDIKDDLMNHFEIKDNSSFIYKGYDINNNLIYYHICNDLSFITTEIQRIFKISDKIILFKLIKEEIIIKYEREQKHLIIINNNNNSKSSLSNFNLFIKEFIFNFNNIEELTIEGYDLYLSQISNNNITTLNFNLSNPTLYKSSFYLQDYSYIFKKLEVLKISNKNLLNDILNNVNIKKTKIKKIIMCSKDNQYSIKIDK